MKYTIFGYSDLNVSRICMGCMGFGDAANGQHSWTIDEEHSRPERLTQFKVAYGASLDAVRVCLDKFFPHIDRERFIFVFFPFLFGVYPYSVATEKQLHAMQEANMDFKLHSMYEMVYQCVVQLLGGAI